MIKSFNLKLNIIVYMFIYLKVKLFNQFNYKIFNLKLNIIVYMFIYLKVKLFN